jgi:predicted DNA-binding transcriptional regulator AlpA
MSDTPQIRQVERAAPRQPRPVAMDRLLTAGDVASLTGLSMETLAQWRSQKRGIPFIKISRNCVRYRQADLDSWLVERTVLTDQERSERR